MREIQAVDWLTNRPRIASLLVLCENKKVYENSLIKDQGENNVKTFKKADKEKKETQKLFKDLKKRNTIKIKAVKHH